MDGNKLPDSGAKCVAMHDARETPAKSEVQDVKCSIVIWVFTLDYG